MKTILFLGLCLLFLHAYATVRVTDLYEVAQGNVVLTTVLLSPPAGERLGVRWGIADQYLYTPYGIQKNLNYPTMLPSPPCGRGGGGEGKYSRLFNQIREPFNIAHNQFGYTGQSADASTDLMMLGKFRNYAPGIGRFIQPDTYNSFSKQHINNPNAYVAGNPVAFVDTTGHIPVGLIAMRIGCDLDFLSDSMALAVGEAVTSALFPEIDISEEVVNGSEAEWGEKISSATSNFKAWYEKLPDIEKQRMDVKTATKRLFDEFLPPEVLRLQLGEETAGRVVQLPSSPISQGVDVRVSDLIGVKALMARNIQTLELEEASLREILSRPEESERRQLEIKKLLNESSLSTREFNRKMAEIESKMPDEGEIQTLMDSVRRRRLLGNPIAASARPETPTTRPETPTTGLRQAIPWGYGAGARR